MKAIDIRAFGAPDVLELVEVASPEVRPDDLLVRVYAAGVNRADLTHRTGGYGRPNFGDSMIIGLEIAGEVIGKGSAVTGFEAGDRIMGVVGGGAYAELARIDYRMAMHIPAQLGYVHAAAIPEVFVTAHEAMMHLARLKAGDSVLIHAAAGGVGSAAVQLAYATGATVYATTDGSKLARVEHLGADVAIDYKTQDFADVIAAKTQGRGVDVIIDFIGAPYFARNIASLAKGGRLVQVGILGAGGNVTVALEDILYRHLQIIGTVMKSRTQPEKHDMIKRFREHWLDRFEGAGSLEPVVDSTFALSRAADAHRRMESSENVGKIILTMQPEDLL
ncbi:putative PIG3 family NAD(P)H quinone oxidoreductase [Pseudomonas sp. LAIL14HWK12:I2]|uniref:NAD(P)H-quinone oxidoreductase n=1 Tax=Pseudomonas TaxID=286 RepID=UPI00087608D2|nr:MULTISPECIES: NAD(P)H-quinone oxidoreductase [Pseudomonas]TFA85521.1 putative PIG3 family NAD(P)H quinone oxidoreductase [Pseudomonas sp. LAIL14HWK12:I2]SCZ40408.1 putative NAD(P)H quinone oxidoreductase, PIG3 family [Pseudomonas sp. NFIX46]SDB53148.1 putative NAD(P)H quinone oxidoreductase, PIG3 family [Pseudomonas putida]SFQ92518.1 putative NAD(P)H quinone oxidoreductase, PIG3 family [Pseudomonas sp. NFIX49]